MNTGIIEVQEVEVDCLVANQPIGPMYIAVMDCGTLEYLSFVDVRRLELGTEKRDVEIYTGIQRQLNASREKEIGKYVNLVDATFPNSIILSISSEDVSYDSLKKKLKIKYRDNVAKVLDGQHRIAGLRHYNGKENSFQCIVTIYVDMELEDQAMVFATINKEQKNVSNSLVADLYEFAQSRSPQKTAHKVARALDAKEGSPFYGKIKILGTANDKDKETITQDTFVKSLMRYITSDPQADRDFYRRNKDKENARPHLVTGTEQKKLFLRNMFITDNTDIKIAQLILNYFAAVSKKWPEAWNNVKPNLILNRSTGFIALMRFLKDVYLHIGKIDDVPTKEEFSVIFAPISLTDDDFNKHRYVPGSTGQKALYQDLLDQANLHQC